MGGEIKIENYILYGAIGLIVVVALILYLRLRDSPKNNLRRARKHHQIGEKLYSEENHEEAKLHYEIAKEYREKALKGEN